MIHITKSRYKPRYKKLKNLKLHGINPNTILKLNKKKWDYIKNFILKQSSSNKRYCLYKFYDQNSYNVSRFINRFSNNYKQKLLSRQNFKILYGGLLTKFLKKSVKDSNVKSSFTNLRINKKVIFLNNLEKRLDVTLVRAHFASSIRSARQFIAHGNVLVNGKVQTKKSFVIQKGDKITFKESVKKIINSNLIYSNVWPIPPKHLDLNCKIFSIVVVDDIIFLNNFYLNTNSDIILENYKNK